MLFLSISVFCCIGTYSVNSNLDDFFITAAFGLLGYALMRLDVDAAPLMLGFIGPMLEEYFRRAMLLNHGRFTPFVASPVSGKFFAPIALFAAWRLIPFFSKVGKAKAAHQALTDLSATGED